MLENVNPKQFIKCLEECQLLGPHNLELLYHLLEQVDQKDFAKQIDEYVERHKDDSLSEQMPNGTSGEYKLA